MKNISYLSYLSCHFTETYFSSKCCRPSRLDNWKGNEKVWERTLKYNNRGPGVNTVLPLIEQEDMHVSLHTSAPLHSGHRVIHHQGVTTPDSHPAASVTQSQWRLLHQGRSQCHSMCSQPVQVQLFVQYAFWKLVLYETYGLVKTNKQTSMLALVHLPAVESRLRPFQTSPTPPHTHTHTHTKLKFPNTTIGQAWH